MDLAGVRVDLPSNVPVVLLREVEGRRILPIFVSSDMATAIAHVLQGVVAPRPLTHDLIVNILGDLGATLESVVITELREGTYYSELHLRIGGVEKIVSSRPSDAIALAIRAEAPIYCDDGLLDAEGVVLNEEEDRSDESDANPEELVENFHEFIEGIRPEDFSS